MTFRQASRADAQALSCLEQELFEAHNYPISKRMFTYHLQKNICFVALDAEEIIGYILLLKRKEWLKIYSLGVAQSHRKKGIAKELLKRALLTLQEQHYKMIRLEVREDNTNAVALYEKYGFVKQKLIPNFYKDGCSAWLMQMSHA